jgi:hypothetical protein
MSREYGEKREVVHHVLASLVPCPVHKAGKNPCLPPTRLAIVRLPDEMVNKIKQLGTSETMMLQK